MYSSAFRRELSWHHSERCGSLQRIPRADANHGDVKLPLCFSFAFSHISPQRSSRLLTQHTVRVLQQLLDLLEEAGDRCSRENTMVGRQGDRHQVADHWLSIHRNE